MSCQGLVDSYVVEGEALTGTRGVGSTDTEVGTTAVDVVLQASSS